MDQYDREQSLKEYSLILEGLKTAFFERWKVNKGPTSSLDQFERIRTLGTGAFGRVMLVKHKRTTRFYAMKILDKGKIIKLKQVDHTFNEKRILQSIKFPFVVFMEYCFKDNSYLYMVLPFIGGGEMFSHLRKLGKFDEILVRFYASQVVLALEYLHHCNLIYRDLKPENILIDRNGYLKMTDFGFCKMINGRTWTLCGTPEYLAPEVILCKGYGKSVDWWGFGILMYEMSAGYPPFYSQQPMKIYEKIVTGKFKNASHFGDDFKDILKNVLQVDLTRRYGNLKDGPMDIKKHSFFRTTDWIQIYNQALEPTYKPTSVDPGDASNFERYDEEPLIIASTEQFSREFAEF